MNTRYFLTALTAGLVLASAPAGAQKLRPFDLAAKDPSFLKYRTALIAALRRGDIDAVVAAAAPGIVLDYGGGKGRAQFRKNLVGDKATYGAGFKAHAKEYRRDLWRMLRLGGGFLRDKQGRYFAAPYTEAWSHAMAQAKRQGRKVKDPIAGWDAYEIAFIVGAKVPVREYPNRYSKVIARLTYNIVQLGKPAIRRKLPNNRSRHLWQSVKLGKGRLGWIRPATYYQSVGYRAEFRKIGGRWQMVRFIAGD